MMQQTISVLIIDDDAFNRDLLEDFIGELGYEVVSADSGSAGWELLTQQPERYHAVLLDRVMPGMDGMEVLRRIKADVHLQMLPVIMETAKSGKEDIAEGLRAGAYYYMTKPLDCAAVQAIVKTAVDDFRRYRNLQHEVLRAARIMTTLQSGYFRIRTLQQAHDLAMLLSQSCPEQGKVAIGLLELLINAVEHGNLGIGYAEKSHLHEQGIWADEVARKQQLPQHADKSVEVRFEQDGAEWRFLIKDEGAGFNWHDYMEIAPERAFDNHGRGIAMANRLSFHHLEYRGIGNEVLAIFKLAGAG